MSVEYTIISIGTLSHNRLWGESAAVRTSHATTTLVADGKRRILVDPSLPATALEARFFERTGKLLDTVTDVYCTCLRPVHRRSIEALPHAKWWAHGPEIEGYRGHLMGLLDSAGRLNPEEVKLVEQDLALTQRFQPAPDKFSEQISLFPLSGSTAGNAGLLLTPAQNTIVIAGDAAVTAEHVMRGQVWEGSADTQAALNSLQDIVELADVIVPGHDNIMLTARNWM